MTATQKDKSVSTTKMFDEDALGSIASFSDALALLGGSGVEIVSTDDLGDGFRVCEDKDRLVKTPFVILNMKFHEGDHGEFVTLHIVTQAGEKLIVNDGSTGIREQARRYYGIGRSQGIMVPRGLVRSDYQYADPTTGEMKGATTFYLS